MTKKKKYTHLREADFNNVKTLQAMPVSNKMINQITGRAPCTLSLIAKSKDYAEYKALTDRKKKPVAPVVEAKEVEPSRPISTKEVEMLAELIQKIDIVIRELDKIQYNTKTSIPVEPMANKSKIFGRYL